MQMKMLRISLSVKTKNYILKSVLSQSFRKGNYGMRNQLMSSIISAEHTVPRRAAR